MSNLPPLPTNPESNPLDTTQPIVQTVNASHKFNPFTLWQYNRWLSIAYISIIIIAFVGLGMLALLLYNQVNANPLNQKAPKSNQSNSITVGTHSSDDNNFFANQQLTVLYYSFAQTSGNKNIFQSTPSDHENRAIDVGFPDKYHFLTSLDGTWLLRWDDKHVERSSAVTPQKFNSIFKLDNKNQRITSVIWAKDASSIAITTNNANNQSDSNSHQNNIIILPLLTLQPVTVYDELADYNLELIKFPTANTLYFVENHRGNKQNLTLFDPQSQAVTRQYTALNQNNILSDIQFSSDMQWAYQVTDTQVIRLNLNSMEKTTIYTTNRDCQVGDPNLNSIAYASIAPSGNKMLITENLTICKRQPRSSSTQPTPIPPTRQTTLFSISEQKVLKREYNLNLPQLSTSLWSPQEDYIWLTVDTLQSYITTVSNLALTPIPSPTRQALTKERVFLIGWLQPKK
jgi:hypothetical protein